MSDASRLPLRALTENRYTIFLTVVVLCALSPALPSKIEPDVGWWITSIGILALMIAIGAIGHRRPHPNLYETIAPFLLFPAIHALRCADGNSLAGFTPLILLPVIWFALYARMREVVLAVVAGALTVFLPMLVIGQPQYPATNWRGVLLLVMISAALGPVVRQLVRTTTRANRNLARSEAEFRAAFEDAPVGMAITALDAAEPYHFVRVNRALCSLFGRTAEEMTSHPVHTFTHPDDIELSQHTFDTINERENPRRVQKRYLHKSGRAIWVSITWSVVQDERGRPSHIISQIEDIDARAESDRVLLDAYETDREANERLARLERVRAEMASTVSHELRTPLTSAAGYVELLVEGDAGPLTDEQRTMLDTVSRSLNRLDGIVGDVLSMASSEHNPTPTRALADMSHVADAAIASIALQAAARGQDLIAKLDLRGVIVAAEAGRLERVLVNLLTNAMKFTPDDGTITVIGEHDESKVSIAVSDTGIGISAEDQQRIFERFYRASTGSDAADDAPAGTGLGLSIVQAITNQYGGTVDVDSELGRGSTFTLTLPVHATR